MIDLPRTFCITLRETPKRRESSQKYFEQIGLSVEFFQGVHGQSFGLKTTIPNYDKLPGREYFITQGAVGCLLSHLMLWNVLLHQPEEEFLILEDDIQICDGFEEKFSNFKSSLPSDWEMAYVGWMKPGGSWGEVLTHVSDNIVIPKPICTHAYMVKKSALKVLIETNQLAWSPLDIQIVERSLPKLHYYASNPSLIEQRSVLNTREETWYSQCYDWDLNPEWLTTKTTNIRMGTGWHPLEKNDDGYMIWSDGRGEFIFDDKWAKMEFDCIVEGEIDKNIRVICPQQLDQVFKITYGQNHIEFPINSAGSVIVVSDTFRPIDIFKTSDARRLGIRFLKGITLTDHDGKSTFVSLYSMYGAKKTEETTKVQGIKMAKIKYSHDDGKVNLRGQFSYNHHRSGWGFVLDLLTDYHREDAPVFDTWLERTFSWHKSMNSQLRLIPYREPWIGVFHHPPNTPNWFTDTATPFAIIQSKEFQDSLPTCKGLYTLSQYHTDFLKCFIKTIPIETLYHPTQIPDLKFSYDAFVKNTDKKIVNIGWWCRKLSSIYQLESDPAVYQKIRLLPSNSWVGTNVVEQIMNIEASFRQKELPEDFKRSVIDVRHMPDYDYDELLSKNIVFVDLYDASANNVIIECIARGTPILINPLPAVVEYLGIDYPFYFNTLTEAANKVRNMPLIKASNDYLLTSGIAEKITGEYFTKTLRSGEIWKSL